MNIFLLTPINPNDQTHRSLLIWADDEKNARENADSIAKDEHKGMLSEKEIANADQFYQNRENAICRELQENIDYKLVNAIEDEPIIEYQNKRYTLRKNDPQIE